LINSVKASIQKLLVHILLWLSGYAIDAAEQR